MRTCLVAALALLALQPAFAQDARPTEESVRHLFEVMNTRHLLDDVMKAMDASMRANIREATRGQPLNPEQEKIREDMLAKMMSLLKEQLDWAGLEPLMTRVYRDTFSQQDVDAMTRFYSSPAGKSIAAKLPVATEESMRLMQERMRPLMPKLAQLGRETAEKLKQAAEAPSSPTSTPPATPESAPH